jgi:hypothetical protein
MGKKKQPSATTTPDTSTISGDEHNDHHLHGPERLHSFRLESPLGIPSDFSEHTGTGTAPDHREVKHEQSWRRQHLRTLSGDIEAAQRPEKETPLTTPSPAANIIETMYRHFWRRKGDVFHLLLSLAIALDDSLWPREDKEEVELFISLVYHVTGVKLKASFAAEGEPAAAGLWGAPWKKNGQSKKYGSRKAWGSWLRRAHIRLKAHIIPYNSGTTAGQALVAPLFQEKEEPAPPAISVASLETLFPRSGPLE